jgi:Ca2+-binding RTX toxin-like protein
MTPDNGKPPKVSQLGDPDLTVMSMNNLAIDPHTFVASMSSQDLEKRYSYGVSLFNGPDKIQGGKHEDQYIEVGEGGKAVVDSGSGDDTVYVWHRKTVDFDGGKGSDTLIFDHVVGGGDIQATIGATVDLGKGTATNPWSGAITLTNVENVVGYLLAANTIIGSSQANDIGSGGFGDTIKGLGGNDVITVQAYFGDSGTPRNMHVDGGSGTDTLKFEGIFGQANTLDLLHPEDNTGTFANSTFKGFEVFLGQDNMDSFTFRGSNAGEKVVSSVLSTASDVFDGRGGDDVLNAGAGADMLTGGTGADKFQFVTGSDTTPAAPDTITDFSHAEHDKIDVSKFFGTLHFIGSAAFDGHANELHFTNQGDQTLVEADFDGDKTADFALLLDGAPQLVAGDFAL